MNIAQITAGVTLVITIAGAVYAADQHIDKKLGKKVDAVTLHQYIQKEQRRELRLMKREAYVLEQKGNKTDLERYILNELKDDISSLESTLSK